MTKKTKEPKLICAYCLKPIKFPAYSLKLDLDLPKIYFCNEIEAEPDYFFYQRKKMGPTTYVIDYNFCSKECMVKYLKKKK